MTRLHAVSWGRLYLALIAAGAVLGAIGGAITSLPWRGRRT